MYGSVAPGWNLSLVIPAYNEEAGIAAAIAEADEVLVRIATDYEILIVDDGSTDRTFAIASAEALCRPKLRVLRHERNRGYGAALRTGFEAARFELVAFTDADCQFYLHDLRRMVPLLESAPIVAGYRVDRKDPWRRRFLSRGYNLLAHTLLGTRVRDCDCALKVFRKRDLSHLLPNSANFFVNTEMLTRARQRNLAVTEIGVTHRPRRAGTSKVSLGDVPRTLATLLPFWWSEVLFPGSAPVNQADGRRATINSFVPFLAIMLMAAVLFFSRIGTPLLEPEEARYAEIPREMLTDGNWLVPHLHGHPYLDKPPLLYWLVMTSYSLFGVHDWAARLVPGLCGWLNVAVAYLWARRTVGARAAFFGALVLCLSAKSIYMGRMLSMNGPLSFFTTATIACAHVAMLPDTASSRRRWYWLLAGLATGLGLLTKGPVMIAVTVPPLLAAMFLDRRLARPKFAAGALFLAALLFVAAPWFVAVGLQQPQFVSYFFWSHNVIRYAKPFDHEGPIWLYLPGLVLGLMPWTLLAWPMLRFMARRSVRHAERRPAALGVFLLCFAWIFMFFSLAGSKRPAYLVPLFPPLALAIGCFISASLPREKLMSAWAVVTRHRARLAYAVTASALGLGLVVALGMLSVGMHKSGNAVSLAGGCTLGLAVFLMRARRFQCTWLLATATTFIVLFAGLHGLLPEYARRFSLRHPVHLQLTPERAGAAVFCYPHVWDSLEFYSGRSDVKAFNRDSRDDLYQALAERDHSLLFVQTKHVAELLRELPVDLEFMPRQHDGGVTVGEVHRRRQAPPLLARGD